MSLTFEEEDLTDSETYVAKNSSGSESRVSAVLSCSPSKIPIKLVELRVAISLVLWEAGANAREPDARKASAVKRMVVKNRVGAIVLYSVGYLVTDL